MKRSEINREIKDALRFFEFMKFRLPPWGYWSMDEWQKHKAQCEGIIRNELGWDLTDFGTGEFVNTGLLLFTIRTGNPGVDQKPYAEKIMIVGENQVTPMHFHWSKMEDIINRGGGNLVIQLYASNELEDLSDGLFEITLDGIKKKCNPGEKIRLTPGESITLHPGLYHEFYGEAGKGKVMVGEVSGVNDDHADNRFHKSVGRFPEIEEDELPHYLLVGDYIRFL